MRPPSPLRQALLEPLVLVAAVAAPALPPAWGAAALAMAVALFALSRPPRREVALAGTALALAALTLATAAYQQRAGRFDEGWRRHASRAYAALWAELGGDAERARAALGRPPADSADPDARLAAFGTLARLSRRAAAAPTLLLFDPDGLAVAWAGEGLLHDLPPEDLPRSGSRFEASFGSVTLMAVVPLDPDERRPWRVVAARSFATDRLPFAAGPAVPRAARWSVVADPAEAARGAVLVTAPDAPPLAVLPPAGSPAGGAMPWRRWAWAAIGFGLLGLGVMRGVGLVLGGAGPPSGRASTAGAGRWGAAAAVGGAAIAGGVAVGMAAAAPPAALAVLAVGLAASVVALAVAGGPEIDRSGTAMAGRWWTAAGGGAAALGLAGAAWAVLRTTGPLDLAAAVADDPAGGVVRLALAAAAFGVLALAARRGGGRPAAADRWGWAAVVLLGLAAALHDLPAAALPLLALGGAAAAVWAREAEALDGGARVAVALVLAALAGATAWETAYRARLRAELAGPLLAAMDPVGFDELAELEARTVAWLETRDPADLVPRDPAGLEHQDLAFVLWRGSPLARANALSAVAVEPAVGEPASFSFGLPLSDDRRVDWASPRWADLRAFSLAGAVAQGEAELTHRGERWATVRFWLVPWPGFRLAAEPELGEVEVGLLRGGPAARRVEGLPEPASFALYTREGRALLTPWEESPPLPPELAAGAGRAAVRTPGGRAWAFARLGPGGWEVLYLPRLTPLRGLERVGTHALAVLLAVAAAALFALLLALPRAAFRDLLRRAVRSYSKRLLLVYTLLLMVPLLALNAVLVAAVEKRLSREQRAAGEAALASTQRLIGDYLLGLEPGFGIDTELNDELLGQLSRVVRHEVNLYWGSAVYASSKPELFAAGLLPKRIPGDIYARLAFRGYELASRTNRAGRTSYLELYAPLRVPGAPEGPGRLFLSMPLLAQQEEVARELANLRRQALLVSAALFGLLAAVGVRLARSFTGPLQELVAGTRRIAGGARSLGLAPTELELAALVEAVDEMAGRIAEGRERLMREKQVVERMVDNITSGVVSLDHRRRVLMHNRVAGELLGVEVGEPVAEALDRSERLAPVADFLAAAGDEPAHATVQLPTAGGEDREWNLVWAPVPGEGEPAALLVVEDATETLRGQRLAAWAEMARIIAHEIKNPLTPIRLNVEHMRQVRHDGGGRFDEVFERCTANVLVQVDELRQIASEFSDYSSILRLDREPGDLAAALGRMVEPYRAAPPVGVTVEFEARPEEIEARFDRKLLGRAVRNLLENALRASAERGGAVTVAVERLDGEAAQIVVGDRGPGVAPADLVRIFDPYFSTHDTGTGLGLPIARRIVEEHGGTIQAHNREGGGLEVAIRIPLE